MNSKQVNPLINGLLFFVALAAVVYFMFRGDPVPQLFWESDKVMHCGAFAVVVVLGYRFLLMCPTCRWWFTALVLFLALGPEFVHGTSLLPRRSFDIWDLVMNLAGCFIGMLIAFGGMRLQLRSPSTE